eukprot:6199857-Pleurochrysis_carterae.AAC.1
MSCRLQRLLLPAYRASATSLPTRPPKPADLLDALAVFWPARRCAYTTGPNRTASGRCSGCGAARCSLPPSANPQTCARAACTFLSRSPSDLFLDPSTHVTAAL